MAFIGFSHPCIPLGNRESAGGGERSKVPDMLGTPGLGTTGKLFIEKESSQQSYMRMEPPVLFLTWKT